MMGIKRGNHNGGAQSHQRNHRSRLGSAMTNPDDKRLHNPFTSRWRRRKDAEHDFRWFKERAEREIRAIIEKVPHFAALDAYTGFDVMPREDDAVQAGFGNRPMGRQTTEGRTASESGAHIVYSLGPTGDVATMLYPAKSDLASVREEVIFLRIGRIGGIPLYNRLARDLRYLVAYERVTSLDASPSVRERMMIGWLRFWNRMQVDGKTTIPEANNLIKISTTRFIGALLGAIIKPLGVLIVAYLLLRFGMPDVAERLFPHR